MYTIQSTYMVQETKLGNMTFRTDIQYLAAIAIIVFRIADVVSPLSYSEQFCSLDHLPQTVNVTNPNNCQMYSSCSGQCGHVKQLTGTDVTMRCSCDDLCVTFGDCCDDFQLQCPLQYMQSFEIMARYGHSPDGMNIECSTVVNSYATFAFIVECTYDPTACTIRQGDPFDRIPVRDLETGANFINARCASCNGVTQGDMWSTTLFCKDRWSLPNTNGIIINETDAHTKNILSSIYNSGCTFVIERPPFGSSYRRCDNSIKDMCASNCANLQLVDACAHNPQSMVYDVSGINYVNEYCALCSSNSNIESQLTCGHDISLLPDGPYPPYSFDVLFKYDPKSNNGGSLPADQKSCPDYMEYINQDMGCREITHSVQCPTGCALETMATVNVTLELNTNTVATNTDENRHLLQHDLPSYENLTCRLIKLALIRQYNDIATVECSTVHVLLSNNTAIVFNLVLLWNSVINSTASNISSDALKNSIHTVANNNAYLFHNHMENNLILDISMKTRVHVPDSTQFCSIITFQEHEYMITNDSSVVEIVSSKQKISNYNVTIHNTTLYVCKHALDLHDETNDDLSTEQKILVILTIVCMSLSGLFLITRIILQFLIPAYKTFPLKLQFCYCIALLVSVIVFFFNPLFADKLMLCKVVGIAMHYAFLATFSWMSVISIDIYRMLRSFGAMQKASERHNGHKEMIIIQLLAWGIPACITAASVMVDNTPAEQHIFKPRYGEQRCWLSPNSYAILVFFIIPICVALVINVVHFILVSVTLRKAFKQRSRMTNNAKSNWSMYLRLFMLMGINSICIFLTPFIDHVVLWIAIIVTTASQGVYIGVVSIFNKQVIVHIQDKCCARCKSKAPSEKPTRETVLHSSNNKLHNADHKLIGREETSISLEEIRLNTNRLTGHSDQNVVLQNYVPIRAEEDGLLEATIL